MNGQEEPLPYRAAWARELRERKRSEATIDNLWRAAVYQVRAEEAEVRLAFALDSAFHVSAIRALLNELERERQRAHLAFLKELPEHKSAEEVAHVA